MEIAKMGLENFGDYVTKNETHFGGKGYHVILKFPNGHGASVISIPQIHGIEVAVLDSNGHLDYTTPITNDVVRVFDKDSLIEIILKIKNL